MSWTSRKVFEQTRTPEGRPIAVAWIHERECGCCFVEGLALDQPTEFHEAFLRDEPVPAGKYPYEPAFGGFACDEHNDQMAVAVAKLALMEPSERPVGELAQETFEQTLEGK